MSALTLVLNKNFYAVHIANWRRAVCLVYQGHAEVVDEDLATYDFESWMELSGMLTDHPAGFIQTPSLRIAVPEIVRLTSYDRLPRREAQFTRRTLYEHYGYRCCYCGERCAAKELTLDHVVPRSRGGATSWDNIVPACAPCNRRKADRLPEEAGLRLRAAPSKPRWGGVRGLVLSRPVPIRPSWRKLLDRVS